jgi:ABC-type glycerol-3-phosphate transport system substrate-binding protein
MRLTKIQIAIIGIVLAIVIAAVLLFMGVIPGLRSKSQTGGLAGSITIWGVFDDEQTINKTLITDFMTANPNVRVTYREMSPDTYEADLVNALAAGTGPDIFMIKNTWLGKHANKISPLPPELLPVSGMGALFPDVVLNDFVAGNQIYALPLYVDTLALFYNKTIFDNASIAKPPTTWDEVQSLIPTLRQIDRTGTITRPAAAIGGSDRNINSASDLLNLVMMQQGVTMTDKKVSRATFGDTAAPAVTFYTDFANPRSPYYTWDPSQHYSLDAFAEEKVGMIFNYAFQVPLLKQKNPFLNFGVAPMPQIKNTPKQANYANYFGLTVSNTSKNKALAWAFIMASTLTPVNNINYLNATGRPPALREVIAATANDPEIGLFSRQALTAVSWPKVDDAGVDSSFSKMVELIINGQLPIQTALKQCEAEVSSIIQRYAPH